MDSKLSEEILLRYPVLHDYFKRTINTPLIEIPRRAGHGAVFAKCEWQNPAGTIKARVALAMLWDLLARYPDADISRLTVLEYSGGTLAIAIAELCAALHMRCVLVLSEATAASILKKIQAHQAEVILTKKELGFWGVMQKAEALSAQNPEWCFLYQHKNLANLEMHYHYTGNEIIQQMQGKSIHACLASIGTGGSLIGVYSKLKEHHPKLQLFAVSPAELPYGSLDAPNGLPKLAGSGGLGCGRKQPFVMEYETHISQHFLYSYPETLTFMKEFYQETGIKIGSSAAANLVAARAVAEMLGEQSNIVTVFPSAGFDEEWAKLEIGLSC